MRWVEESHQHVVRAANDAVRLVADDWVQRSFLCECDDGACARHVLLTAEGYDERRLAPDPRILHAECAERQAPTPRRPLRRTLAALAGLLR